MAYAALPCLNSVERHFISQEIETAEDVISEALFEFSSTRNK